MAELGQKLKEARQAKGLSLDELQDITKIQKRYLVSIEEGNLNVLPGEFYVRAFIKQYAEAVELEPEALLEEHKNELPLPPAAHDVTQLSRVKRSRETVPNAASAQLMDYMPKILITLLVISVGVGIWLVFQALASRDTNQGQQNATKAKIEKVQDSPLDKKAEEPKKSDQPAQQTQQTQPAQPAQPVQELKVVGTSGKNSTMELRNNTAFLLEITAKGRAYIDIKNGAGKLFLSKTLNAGETVQQDLSAEDVVRLNIGSSPNTEIKINGQAVSYPQDPNNAYHQILLINNLRTQQQQPAQQ
ncbi:helix-turn-helix domain-containing protein [Ectobacillus panaciterrae]|uniref:helix-turn-helix domain-containing protein n=1 Tax=Ectobacillus panaciterrae TaxID=363872 RepID=UPI00040F2B25|nr:RodZ domain-containing protein [Ectobacillus panaciterrae]